MLLADTSAWIHSSHPDVANSWAQQLQRDQVATCAPVRLEVLYTARSVHDYWAISARLDVMHQLTCGDTAMDRALEVQRLLAEQHALHHRSVSIPDLIIAAAAELAGATIWHYDEDYDRIAVITGQPTEWIALRGSL